MADDVNPDDLEIADELIAERRSAKPWELPDDMPKWQSTTISVIDTFSEWTGKIVAWLLVPLCAAMTYEVVVRKLGTDPGLWLPEIWRLITGSSDQPLVSYAPTLWAYDVSRMLYGALFMLGAGYALAKGVHIRADFIYRHWSDRFQASVDLLAFMILYFPGMLFLFYYSAEFAWTAWDRNEKAMDTAWMPRLGPIKSALPIGVAFLLIQGVSEVLKCIYTIRKGRWPV